MADEQTRAALAQLRAELAEQRATFTAQIAAMQTRRERPRRRLSRRFLPLALVALLVALAPLSLLAANPFTDLQAGSVHNANIDAIYAAGITTGCVPNAQYCPTDTVTRQEMASFLARTAGLGANPPVANARTAQTAALATNAMHATSADTATNAATAGNANTVGGYAPSGLLRVARVTTTSGAQIALTGAYKSIANVTITAPGPGFILVSGALQGHNNGNNCSTSCPVLARLVDTGTGGASSPQLQVWVSNTLPDAALAPTYVFTVTGAGPHVYALQASKQLDGYMNITASNAALVALYVPFGYDGGTTLAPAP